MEYPAFFGETLPVISRAVEGDEDEDVHIDTKCTLVWSPHIQEEMNISADGCLQCAMVVIAVGDEAVGFAETYLLHDDDSVDLLGVISPGTPEVVFDAWDQKPTLKDKRCFIRRSKQKPSVLVITCNCHITQYQAASWTDQLFGSISLKGSQVLVLTTDLISHYRSEACLDNDLNIPFLRCLKTSAFQSTPCATYLEQPNVIGGLPAQILTLMQVQQVEAVVYTCFKDISSFDINSTKLFKKILRSAPLKDFTVDTAKSDKKLVQLVEIHKDRSTLYI